MFNKKYKKKIAELEQELFNTKEEMTALKAELNTLKIDNDYARYKLIETKDISVELLKKLSKINTILGRLNPNIKLNALKQIKEITKSDN